MSRITFSQPTVSSSSQPWKESLTHLDSHQSRSLSEGHFATLPPRKAGRLRPVVFRPSTVYQLPVATIRKRKGKGKKEREKRYNLVSLGPTPCHPTLVLLQTPPPVFELLPLYHQQSGTKKLSIVRSNYTRPSPRFPLLDLSSDQLLCSRPDPVPLKTWISLLDAEASSKKVRKFHHLPKLNQSLSSGKFAWEGHLEKS